MHRNYLLLFAIVISSPAPSSPASIVTVDGTPITDADLEAALAALGAPAQEAARDLETRAQIIDDLVSRKVLERAASVSVTDDDAELTRRLAFLKTEQKIRLYIERESAKRLDEASLKRWFEEQSDRFALKEVRTMRIFSNTKERAEAWRKELDGADRARFEAFAAKSSEDQNASTTKGDAGFARRGALEEPIDAFAFKGAVGDLSPVLTVKAGYAIVLITEIKPGKPVRFEDVRSDVQRLARADAARRITDELRSRAKIEWTNSAGNHAP